MFRGASNMEPKSYAVLLAEYASQFGDLPPSILTEEGAGTLMAQALTRGRHIGAADLRPAGDAMPPLANELRSG
jgi:hypothetical protein